MINLLEIAITITNCDKYLYDLKKEFPVSLEIQQFQLSVDVLKKYGKIHRKSPGLESFLMKLQAGGL